MGVFIFQNRNWKLSWDLGPLYRRWTRPTWRRWFSMILTLTTWARTAGAAAATPTTRTVKRKRALTDRAACGARSSDAGTFSSHVWDGQHKHARLVFCRVSLRTGTFHTPWFGSIAWTYLLDYFGQSINQSINQSVSQLTLKLRPYFLFFSFCFVFFCWFQVVSITRRTPLVTWTVKRKFASQKSKDLLGFTNKSIN